MELDKKYQRTTQPLNKVLYDSQKLIQRKGLAFSF